MEEGQVIESKMVSRRIEGAQRKVEERNFDIRKNLLEYDEVMDFQRKSVYGYRQRILDGANCKELIHEMLDEQVEQHLGQFMNKDYEAESFAAWVSARFNGIEFEARDFRRMDFKQAEEFAVDHARRMSETMVLDSIEENLPDDADEEEWNWQALAHWSNNSWRTSYTEKELKKVGRQELSTVLIEKAHKFIENVDLTDGAQLLEQNYGLRTALAWLKQKFGIAFDFEEAKNLPPEKLRDKIRKLTHEKYREKEIQFPVLGGLYHFTVNDQNGRRYDREGLVEWAKQRFGVELSLEDLKNKQRYEIEAVMFEQSKNTSEHVPAVYQELREKLDVLMKHSGIDPDELRRKIAEQIEKSGAGKSTAGSKFAVRSVNQKKTHYVGKYSTIKTSKETGSAAAPELQQQLKNDTELQAFCDWANGEFTSGLTPEKMLKWDVAEVEDRMCSLVEDKYSPEMRAMERNLVLNLLDTAWKDHLLVMDHLRSGIGLMGYAQVDPKVAYKREGMQIFGEMWKNVYARVTDLIFRMEQLDPGFVSATWQESEARHDEVAAGSTVQSFTQQQKEQVENADNVNTSDKKLEPIRNKEPKVGPYSPCPCGSGKKYKHCCGKNG
ncbi:MAG: SEC-C domain-containing protein [Planctomycetaceae bacterium]|nr:SEC-C domain-containing protein [Planctomycetaceae bacterium]